MQAAGDSRMPGHATGPGTMHYAEATDLARVRRFVQSGARALGLPERRAELLTLAVSELATNTLQHTDGGGQVRIGTDAGWLVCDVVDRGPLRILGRDMPAAGAVRGRGLAIVERICDEVTVAAEPAGTRVRLRMRL
jgi:serine/threonine-protein kinase RsbW